MVSLITEKLRKQLLEDNGAEAVRQEELSEEAEKRPVILALQHQLSLAVQNNFLETQTQPKRSLCQCSPQGTNRNELISSQQIDTPENKDEGCHLCQPSADMSSNNTKKRQCHMMSTPDESDENPWRRDWRPQETSIWRPVGINADQAMRSVLGCRGMLELGASAPGTEWGRNDKPRRRTSNSSESPSPILRPSSALSGFSENFCSPMNAVGHRSDSAFSPSLSAFSLTGLSLDEMRQPIQTAPPGSSGSMPAIGGEDFNYGSLIYLPQRCHSQPSVLLERRGFKKRRHDEKRPNLNFIKMKETAYAKRHQSYGRARNIAQFVESTNKLQATEHDSKDQSRFFYSLDTIASSPLELTLCPSLVSLCDNHPLEKSGCGIDDNDRSARSKSLDRGRGGNLAPHLDLGNSNDLRPRCGHLDEGIEEEEEALDLDALDDLDVDEIEKD